MSLTYSLASLSDYSPDATVSSVSSTAVLVTPLAMKVTEPLPSPPAASSIMRECQMGTSEG